MTTLEKWQQKIIARRKQTPFKEFIIEMGSWNPIKFYRNNGLISKYPVSSRANVLSLKDYNEQRDGFCDYGRDFVWDRDFFVQLQELSSTVPCPSVLHIGNNENCDFCETAVHAKDAYLSSIVTHGSEKVLYSDVVREWCRNVLNSCYVQYNSENIYCCLGIETSYQIFYSRFINNSNNIWFSTNLIGCSECLFCNGLENKKFCIENRELEESEYRKQKSEILAKKSHFLSWYKNLINIKWTNYNSTNVSGSNIIESENVENGFVVMRMKNARNVLLWWGIEVANNIYDHFLWGVIKDNIVWVTNCGGWSEHIYVSANIGFSNNIYYSIGLDSCSFCLWCVSLKNKQYCILNKQYTKEDWYTKVEEIFQGMEKNGTFGEFFPGYINPFYFNDTFGGLLSKNITENDAVQRGYLWRKENEKADIPAWLRQIGTRDLDTFQGFDQEGNWNIDASIVDSVIIDDRQDYYRIMPLELSFLQKYGLPIPEIHWTERRKLHFSF